MCRIEEDLQMPRKPLIGINTDFRTAVRTTPAFAYIAEGYYQNIIKAGGVPMLVPPQQDEESVHRVLDAVDGFLFIGGADLDPRNDGFMLHPSVRPLNPGREKSDRMLMAEIAERRMPVFGIGVGMQLINVQQGGNLFLHIKEDLPLAVPHLDVQDTNHRHTLDVVSDSLIGRVYGDGEIRVTSRHHMAIDEVAPGFRITARCPDGVIEAIESEMLDWFAIGTQFHPESEAASALDIRIFEEFVDAVRARSERLEGQPQSGSFQLVA
jgi:putative glutamine amidotransferase